MWVHLHPQGGEKNWGKSHGKFVSVPLARQVHPQAEQKSIFRTFVALVLLDRLLEATTIKGRQLLYWKRAPQTKSWLRLWNEVIYSSHKIIREATTIFSYIKCTIAFTERSSVGEEDDKTDDKDETTDTMNGRHVVTYDGRTSVCLSVCLFVCVKLSFSFRGKVMHSLTRRSMSVRSQNVSNIDEQDRRGGPWSRHVPE